MSFKLTHSDVYYKISSDESYYKVTVVEDSTAPTIVSAVIPADGLTVLLTFSEALNENRIPTVGRFSMGGGTYVDAVSISGNTSTLTLGVAVGQGVSVQFEYASSSTGYQDDYKNLVATTGTISVTNNSEVT